MYKDKKFVMLPNDFAVENVKRGFYLKDTVSGFKYWLPKKSVKIIFDPFMIFKFVVVDAAYLAHFKKIIKLEIAKEKGGDKK